MSHGKKCVMICLFADTVLLSTDRFLLKYFLICSVSINVIPFVLPSCEARKYCHGEYSIVKDTNDTVLWLDHHHSDSPIVFSSPSCLDENGRNIQRTCHNGSWIPEYPPLCHTISTNQYCPDDFYEYRGFCIIKYDHHKTRNSIFQEENFLNSQNTNNVSICDDTSKHNVQTNPNSTKIETYNRPFLRSHCNASNYIVLPNDHRFQFCPENCIPAELGSRKCYCKVKKSSQHKLATVETLLQKKVLAKLAGNDICELNSDFLSEICHCQRVITHNFYGLTANGTNCSIIETNALKMSEVEEPSITLTFNDRKRQLLLLVQNSRGISPSVHYSLECFTNAGTDITRKVRISRLNEGNPKAVKNFTIYDLKLEKFIGEYWCEALSVNLKKITSNIVLAYREERGNEYSLTIFIRDVSSHFEYNHDQIRIDSLQKKLSSDIRKLVKVEVRFMEYLQMDLDKAELLLHLSTVEPRNIQREYEHIKEKLEQLPEYLKVLSFRAVGYCLPDTTQTQNSGILHWDLTNVWERRIPKELCLQDNYLPVMRTCRGNFVSGAYWSELSGNCAKGVDVPTVTKFLHEGLYKNISKDFIDNVTSITINNSLSYLDIYLYSELIKKVNVETDDNIGTVQNVFKIVNNLSDKNKTELNSSQILFNATDSLLILLDVQSSSKYLNLSESYLFAGENILIKSVNPFKTNVSGIYLLGNANAPLNEMEVKTLRRNESMQDIDLNDLKNLDLAVDVPEEVLEGIAADSDDPSSVKIIFTVFLEDSLFVSKDKTASKVVSVTIPGYGSYLNDSIPIVMRSSEPAGRCGYWNLGQKIQRQKGEWSSFGGTYSGRFLNNTALHVCHFSHLTHFALLIVSEPIKVEEGDQKITEFIGEEDSTSFHLTVITIIGTMLSIIGVLGIYLTAILFSQWREKDGTKILLNLSTAIVSEIILLQFSGVNELGSNSACKLIGCLLHYTLLSKFCWMLIYALLQYRRFVKVFGAQPKNLILKSILFGWGFAILPVTLTLLISPDSYSKTNICYLHGLPLYIAVIFPVLLVIISNLVVFIIVMYNVTTKKVESTVETKLSMLQLYLAILLFSVLGLPWLFAIMAEFVTATTFKTILMYLFCITGTLQGFILFIFYVLINEETRQRWKKYFSNYKSK